MSKFTESIDRASALQAGWDGYGGPPISAKALTVAEHMIATAIVVPMSNGGLIVDLGDGAIEFEITEDGEVAR